MDGSAIVLNLFIYWIERLQAKDCGRSSKRGIFTSFRKPFWLQLPFWGVSTALYLRILQRPFDSIIQVDVKILSSFQLQNLSLIKMEMLGLYSAGTTLICPPTVSEVYHTLRDCRPHFFLSHGISWRLLRTEKYSYSFYYNLPFYITKIESPTWCQILSRKLLPFPWMLTSEIR